MYIRAHVEPVEGKGVKVTSDVDENASIVVKAPPVDVRESFLEYLLDNDEDFEFVELKHDDGGQTLDIFVAVDAADTFRRSCPSTFQGVRTIVIEVAL